MQNLQHNSRVIIAGASVRSLAESAVAAGFQPICIDMFCDADLRQLMANASLRIGNLPTGNLPTGNLQTGDSLADNSLADNLRLISDYSQLESKLAGIDPSVPLIPVGGLEFFGAQLDRIRIHRPVYAMAKQVIEQLRDPIIIFPLLQKSGFQVPNFQVDAADQINAKHNWLKKDSLSSGGHSVSRIDLHHWQQHDGKLSPSEYLQQEVSGIPCSATFLATKDHSPKLLGCAIQLCAEPSLNATGFQFCGNVGPVRFPDSAVSELQNMASCLQQHWPLQGVFGIDFIWNGEDAFVIEINPRLTASHAIHDAINPANSAQLAQHCAAFRSLPDIRQQQPASPIPEARPLLAPVSCRMIVYSNRTLKLTTNQHADMMQRCSAIEQQDGSFWFSDIPDADSIVPAGAPLCSLNLTADTFENLSTSWQRVQPQWDHGLSIVNYKAISEMIGRLQSIISDVEAVEIDDGK